MVATHQHFPASCFCPSVQAPFPAPCSSPRPHLCLSIHHIQKQVALCSQCPAAAHTLHVGRAVRVVGAGHQPGGVVQHYLEVGIGGPRPIMAKTSWVALQQQQLLCRKHCWRTVAHPCSLWRVPVAHPCSMMVTAAEALAVGNGVAACATAALHTDALLWLSCACVHDQLDLSLTCVSPTVKDPRWGCSVVFRLGLTPLNLTPTSLLTSSDLPALGKPTTAAVRRR